MGIDEKPSPVKSNQAVASPTKIGSKQNLKKLKESMSMISKGIQNEKRNEKLKHSHTQALSKEEPKSSLFKKKIHLK